MEILCLSKLNHTWLFDLDGTIVKHNGHLSGHDEMLPGVKELWDAIPYHDLIIILTSRSEKYRDQTIRFLDLHNLRYNHILFDLPVGERILLNDTKPGGLLTAVALNVTRDKGFLSFKISREDSNS